MRTQTATAHFVRACHARNLTKATIDWYRDKLQRFAKSCPELPYYPGPIDDFLASLTCSAETKHAHFRALRALYRFISDRYDSPYPMAKVVAPRRPKKIMATLEADELMRLLASADTPRERALLTLLIDTGLRATEVAGVCRNHIKADTVQVWGKSGQREVPVSEETRRLLLALAAGSDGVFRGPKGPLTRHGIYSIVRRLMTKAGIAGPKLGAHRIRHAFGKGYLVAGGDTRSLQEIMGHANITTTEKYTSLNLSDTIVKHRRYTPLRLAHGAAQGALMKEEAVQEAEAIVRKKQ